MAWSKTTRIKVMLAIDIIFFVIELTVGFAVHSLALMADAFHMLNDVISLAVGLWAVSISKKATTVQYTYGWQRAEILGAFFNAVFLIALCVSIILEAVTRLIDPPEITNAKLILVVGSVGLASNVVGYFVLDGHGHSHGPAHDAHGHGHGAHPTSAADRAEEGRAGYAADESGPAMDVLPQVAVARLTAAGPATPPRRITFDHHESPRSDVERSASRTSKGRRTPAGSRHGRLASIDDLSIHPASFRQEIMEACKPQPEDESSSSEDSRQGDEEEGGGGGGGGGKAGGISGHQTIPDTESTPLLRNQHAKGTYSSRSTSRRGRRNSGIHDGHNHSKPRASSGKGHGHGHGHGHGDMGMNAMVLHVIGDALGNVGVIITALIIWLTSWSGKLYADPAVSLLITVIILRSAIPLTKTTSRVLLQATPNGIDARQVQEDIESLPGVEACHDVHIWQLSDTTIVASMHVRVQFPAPDKDGEQFMELSRRARRCFHAYGIHSATIQPEFWTGTQTDRQGPALDGPPPQLDGAPECVVAPASGDGVCLLECVDDCTAASCCVAAKPRPTSTSRPGSTRSGADPHDHSRG